MIQPGLVSVTFRQLTPGQIIDLAVQAGLAGIEWGGDVHVPHGQIHQAQEVARMTREAGLAVAAYGSYYRVGHGEADPFAPVLESALALGAPRIRVWAGKEGTDTADAAYFNRVVAESRQIGDLAAAAGVDIVYEFHARTLTDTNQAARRLLEAVDHPHVRIYWQPPRYSEMAYNLAGIEAVAPWLAGLHIFHWHEGNGQRLPLAEGQAAWRLYLEKALALGFQGYGLLEFVQGDSPEQFLADAEALRSWLGFGDS